MPSKKKPTDPWADVWPQERDLFFRPERYRYVRKLIKSETCVFCGSAEKGVSEESLLLHQDQNSLVVLNKFPYNTGHLLVLPKRHVGNLEDLKESEYLQIQLALRKSVSILKQAYQTDGINLGMNLGKVAGAGIPEHLHWHLVPRWMGDTNFFPLIAETKVLPETLEQSYRRLLPYFKELQQA